MKLKHSALVILASLAVVTAFSVLAADARVAPAPNGIATAGARADKTKPWPDGRILGKLVWKERTDAAWPTAFVPDAFVHAEFMVKDAKKYAATGGWGYARWTGMDQKPYGKDASFVQECVACHTPVKGND